MAITFQCEHCRKQVQAPDEAAGRRGKCPHCGHSNYIPAPVAEDEILDLAPLDEAEERRRKEELHRLRQQARALLEDDRDAASVPLDQKETVTSEDLHHFVVNYCLDMFGSKLERLRTHVFQLRKYKAVGLAAIDDFLSGRVKEPALRNVPGGALKAFLMKLKEEVVREK